MKRFSQEVTGRGYGGATGNEDSAGARDSAGESSPDEGDIGSKEIRAVNHGMSPTIVTEGYPDIKLPKECSPEYRCNAGVFLVVAKVSNRLQYYARPFPSHKHQN